MKKVGKYKYSFKIMSNSPGIIGSVLVYMANAGMLLREDTNAEMIVPKKRRKHGK